MRVEPTECSKQCDAKSSSHVQSGPRKKCCVLMREREWQDLVGGATSCAVTLEIFRLAQQVIAHIGVVVVAAAAGVATTTQ